MKKFTFVVALAGACVGMAMAQTSRVAKLDNLLNETILKGVDIETPMLSKNVSTLTPSAQFNFVKENQKQLMRKPAQTAALNAPEALPATDASLIGFIANWNTVEGANYYEADVYRSYKTSVDTIYYSLVEDFYFTEPSTESYVDYLWDNAYRWDWGLLGGELGDQCIILPNDVEAGAELDTPELDLALDGTAETGTIILTLVMDAAVGDRVGLGYFYYDEAAKKEKVLELGAIEFDTESMAKMYFLEDMPLSTSAGFFLYTHPSAENAGDVKIQTVMVSQPVNAGTEFVAFYNYYQTPGTSTGVLTLERESGSAEVTDDFMYCVYALDVDMSTGSILDGSDMSNMIVVELEEESAVEGVKANNDKIFVHDNLHVVLEAPATVYVYNMAGVLIESVQGVEGDNEIVLPAAGAYVVKAGNTVTKVMK